MAPAVRASFSGNGGRQQERKAHEKAAGGVCMYVHGVRDWPLCQLGV